MAEDARTHWNRRYREGWPTEPSVFLRSLDDALPQAGRALDVAGGNARNALWLARRGLEVTIVDVSDEALAVARAAADDVGLPLRLVSADLTTAALPEGPWDLILCFHYLQRDLFPKMISSLAHGGVLACAIATARNMERHPRPPRPYVLDEGELPGLVQGLTVVRYEEGWFDDHHEARAVAKKGPVRTG